jgi:hypothetical protein
LAGNSALAKQAVISTSPGNSALGSSTGSSNIALGTGAGASLTSGSSNIFIGNSAGGGLVSGSQNIYIGSGAASGGESNSIHIGNAHTTTLIAGIRGVGVAGGNAVVVDASGQLGDATISSRRVKEDIRDMGEASARLLQPVPSCSLLPAGADGSKPIEFGLIAEEVAEVMPELVVYDKDGQPQTIQYHVLPALLLNELQHQQKELAEQEAELAELRAQKEEVAALRQALAAQAAELAELKAALWATLAQR